MNKIDELIDKHLSMRKSDWDVEINAFNAEFKAEILKGAKKYEVEIGTLQSRVIKEDAVPLTYINELFNEKEK